MNNTADFDRKPDTAWVDVRVVGALLDKSTNTVWRYAKAGLIPQPRKFGGSTLWNVGQLRKVLAPEAA